MKTITVAKITATVRDLCIRANTDLRKDVFAALAASQKGEKNKTAREMLGVIIRNARIARKEKLAICQDTGMPCVFMEIGRNIKVSGDLKAAVNRGIESGYRKGFFRNSVVKEPLSRGKSGYGPAVMHIDIVPGSKLKITVLPKGFGCENKSQLRMFKPTAEWPEIKKFIVEAVKSAGPDACPPYVVGVGIGGTADYAMLLAKKALLRKVHSSGFIVQGLAAKLEKELFKDINKLNIGPMGLGGKSTCLAVNILTYPTHIAGLPIAVNISCHALRSASAKL
ncbi:fumarate hydratase [bacterium]|nr:MAG: fumarate hydratase [bacterium]